MTVFVLCTIYVDADVTYVLVSINSSLKERFQLDDCQILKDIHRLHKRYMDNSYFIRCVLFQTCLKSETTCLPAVSCMLNLHLFKVISN